MSAETMMPVEFVTTTQMGEKGQVTVPKRYRDALKLETGAPMAVLRLGEGLLLIPEQARFRQLCDRIADIFASHGVTEAELLASLPEARRRVFERYYPELAKTESLVPESPGRENRHEQKETATAVSRFKYANGGILSDWGLDKAV